MMNQVLVPMMRKNNIQRPMPNLFTGAPQGQCFVVWVPRSFAIAVGRMFEFSALFRK